MTNTKISKDGCVLNQDEKKLFHCFNLHSHVLLHGERYLESEMNLCFYKKYKGMFSFSKVLTCCSEVMPQHIKIHARHKPISAYTIAITAIAFTTSSCFLNPFKTNTL